MKVCANDNCSATVWDDDQIYCSGSCQILHHRNMSEANSGVAKRGAIDLIRARGRAIRLFEKLPRPAPVDDVTGPLDRALRKLRPEDAALVLMQAAGGFSYEELARIEGKTAASIRSRLFRARRELAQRYDEEGGEW
jgi:RNA polymerase sigma-70 factor (ECF subfamily)